MPSSRPPFAAAAVAAASLLSVAAAPLAARDVAAAVAAARLDARTPPPAPGRATRTATFRSVTGEIYLEDSVGRVNIQAWDEPHVRLTVEKNALRQYTPDQAKGARKELESVRVWTERTPDGGLRVRTESDGVAAVEMAYTLQMPRGLPVRIRHESGKVEIAGLMGSIHATVDAGHLSVRLVDDEPVKLDARVRAGEVRSSLPAAPRRDNAAPPRILYLRVGAGRIEVHRDSPRGEFSLPVELID